MAIQYVVDRTEQNIVDRNDNFVILRLSLNVTQDKFDENAYITQSVNNNGEVTQTINANIEIKQAYSQNVRVTYNG